ncbi:RusA family crossover junction endodeoxyribonuclease [Streptomyces avidinii]|uniref:RusA family crossover junction endodeoxyribonuclease n=1 Tax=Streptomyces avidinii TaxID=1895 RepID=UPI00379C1224
MTHPQVRLSEEFAKLTDQDPPAEHVQAVVRAYTEDTGEPLGKPATAEQVQHMRRWMMAALGDFFAIVLRRQTTLQPVVHFDAATKASWLQQTSCCQCRTLGDDDRAAHPISFSIPVRPFTKQNAKTKTLIHNAVRAELVRTQNRRQDVDAWKNVAICATVVAVQPHNTNIIDVDNAAKAILDTLSGILFPDDRQIQHLSVSRLNAPGTTGYYLIKLRPVYSYLDDVIHPAVHARNASPIQPPALGL